MKVGMGSRQGALKSAFSKMRVAGVTVALGGVLIGAVSGCERGGRERREEPRGRFGSERSQQMETTSRGNAAGVAGTPLATPGAGALAATPTSTLTTSPATSTPTAMR